MHLEQRMAMLSTRHALHLRILCAAALALSIATAVDGIASSTLTYAFDDLRETGVSGRWHWLVPYVWASSAALFAAAGSVTVATLAVARRLDGTARRLCLAAAASLVIVLAARGPLAEWLVRVGTDPDFTGRTFATLHRALLAAALVIAVRASGVRIPRRIAGTALALATIALPAAAFTSWEGRIAYTAAQGIADAAWLLLVYLCCRWLERAAPRERSE